MTKNIIISVLLVIIALLLNALDPRGMISRLLQPSATDGAISVHKDSVIVAQAEIKALFAREKMLILKGEADSVKRAKEKIAHKKEVAYYKRRLSEINFDGTTSLELDSIRNAIYPPGDSSHIVAGPDPLYSMPISEARDALEAKAREPLRDSTDAENEARIATLEKDLDNAGAHCADRLAVKDSVYFDAQVAIRNLSAVVGKYEKKEHQRRKWGWVKDVGAFAVGLLAGRGSKR